MFWGLIMEPNKRYTQTVEKPFHISQAAMDTSTGDSEVCQVMVVVDGKNFLICTLQKNKTIQVPLDLYFKTGNVISFLTNGKCNVHLTGYLDPEFDEDDEEEDEDEDEEEEQAPELVPAKNKRKLDSSTESATKKLKAETKKQLKQQLNSSQDSDEEEEEEDDSSDEDGVDDLQKLLSGDVDSDENDESFKPNSTGGDSEEESGEEEEEEEEAEAQEEDTTQEEADTSKQEEPAKLSRSARRKLKKLEKQQEQQQPQTNGLDKKKVSVRSMKNEPEPQKLEKKQKKAPKDGSGDHKQATPDKKLNKTISGGVHIEDLKVGGGAVASAGKEVEVYYEGRLKQNNKMFDNCKKGAGFRFRVGHKEVITGWDVGIAGMKVGGKRKIVCPPSMAYGAKGSPPVIPPNATLVFEVELKKVK